MAEPDREALENLLSAQQMGIPIPQSAVRRALGIEDLPEPEDEILPWFRDPRPILPSEPGPPNMRRILGRVAQHIFDQTTNWWLSSTQSRFVSPRDAKTKSGREMAMHILTKGPAMSPEEIAFMESIKEVPEDDARRLIYADWLDEKAGRAGFKCDHCDGTGSQKGQLTTSPCQFCYGVGDRSEWFADFAAFIRQSINVERDRPNVNKWLIHTDRLFTQWGKVWMGYFYRDHPPQLTKPDMGGWGHVYLPGYNINSPHSHRPAVLWRRGFPCEFRCSQDYWVNNGPVACALWPITRVFLNDVVPSSARWKSGGKTCYTFWRSDAWDAGTPSRRTRSTLNKLLMPDPDRRRCNYKTENDAIKALSEACLRWGRYVAKIGVVSEESYYQHCRRRAICES